MNTSQLNQRVLIVDDEEVVRDSLRESLCHRKMSDTGLDAAADALFGEAPTIQKSSAPFSFEVTEASNGHQALDIVRAAAASNNPFAVIFMDMRMPGMDGLETVQEIRRIDHRAEIVFVTAYSDHSIEEIVDRAGPGVGYYCKPFAPDEIRQVAIKATYDWNHNRDLEKLIGLVAGLRTNESQTRVLLVNILSQISAIIGANSALIARRISPGSFRVEVATGRFLDEKSAAETIEKLSPRLAKDSVFPIVIPGDHLIVFHLDSNHFVALLETGRPLRADKLYLLTLFLETAGSSLENARLQGEASEKERLYTLGHALGGIVHDLRNPVGAVLTLAELQTASLAAGNLKAATEECGMIHAAGNDAMDLLEDLLDFTRGQEAAMEDVSVPALLDQAERRAKTIFEGRSLACKILKPAPCTISAQPKKLIRVLLNLLKNAAEALEASRMPGAEILLSAERDGPDIVFRVTDNGPGIPPAVMENLFRPFFTSGKAHGTGLGLAIVRQIVEAHGSRPEVESAPGKTVFSFRLPLKNP